jgi:hypothetical protein
MGLKISPLWVRIAKNRISGSTETGLNGGVLGVFFQEISFSPPMKKREVLQGEKPACLELFGWPIPGTRKVYEVGVTEYTFSGIDHPGPRPKETCSLLKPLLRRRLSFM